MRLNQRLILFGLVAMLWSLSFPAAAQDSATVFRIEYRFADQKQERLPELAVELVHLKFDVILAGGLPGVSAAKGATTTIPIVMTTVGIPWPQGWLPVWRGQEEISPGCRV